MKKECAFCSHSAKLSAEHIWSDWMSDLFPGKKRFTRKNEQGEVVASWTSETLDWKAKVVCEQCNNTWMSQIENEHAKPAMTDLIKGRLDILISASRARSLALFGFKEAVVFDHIARKREPFFIRSLRHGFRESLSIPITVNMWMAGFLPAGKGEVITSYHEGNLSPTNRLKLYVCTYAVGRLVIQIVAQRQSGFKRFAPRGEAFKYLSIPFWPRLPDDLVWPPPIILGTPGDFDAYAARWSDLAIIG